MPEKKKSVTYDLEWPVDYDGREVTQLTFRRMRAGDALIAEDETNQARAGYALYAALAGVDIDLIGKLDIDDIEGIAEAIVPLMGKSAEAEHKRAKEAEEKARKAAALKSTGAT